MSTETTIHQPEFAGAVPAATSLGPRLIGYGLPCVKCRLYYSAALTACPICQCRERVSPIAAPACPGARA